MPFDDLPKVAASHIQSTKSADRLRLAFGPERFVLREEKPDYGTDFQAELVVQGSATNFRFHIQLKSEHELSFVENGQYGTVAIETSRLNYLLRGTGRSILALYDEASDTLRYDWVDEIVNRLDHDRPTWRGQETVTVRIPTANVLESTAVETIHEVNRAFHERLSELQSTALGYVVAPPEGAAALVERRLSPADLLQTLESNGLAVVSSGLQREVAELLDSVPAQTWVENRRLVLVAAFAYYQLGAILQALSYCNLAQRQSDQQLSEEEAALLDYLGASAKRSIGHLTADQYHKEIDQLGRNYPHTTIGLQAHLETLLRCLVSIPPREDPRNAIGIILTDAREAVAKATDSLKSNESRWGAALELAAIELEAGNQLSANGVTHCQLAEQLGQPVSIEEKTALATSSIELIEAGSQRAEEVYQLAGGEGSEAIKAQALLTLVIGHMRSHVSLMLISPEAVKMRGSPQEARQLREWASASANAGEIFHRLGYHALAFRAARTLAECLDLLGAEDERDQVVESLRKNASMLGLHPDTVRLSTQDLRFAGGAIADDRRSRALFWQGIPDDVIERFARKLIDASKLPEERLDIVVRDFHARRTITAEQLGWCKHIELLQDLRHTQSPETHYARDPEQVCTCEKFGHRSAFPHSDVSTVIAAFKAAYCASCPARETW